jgi:acyl-CoA thioester hydrolase
VSGFTWSARVYWEDTDGGGVVYYANYLRFLERARTEWLRSLGFSQQALAHDPGIVFTVMRVSIDYRRPARLDDVLTITCEFHPEGAASMSFGQRIYRAALPAAASDEQLLAEADVRVACVDARTFRPTRIPATLVNALSGPA